MFRVLLVLGLTFLLTAEATAWPRVRRRVRRSYAVSSYSFSGGPQAVAEAKVALLAARGYGFHPGGGYGGGSAEGWGWGVTPAAARANCCFAGYRRVAGSAVARCGSGYFAIQIYY